MRGRSRREGCCCCCYPHDELPCSTYIEAHSQEAKEHEGIRPTETEDVLILEKDEQLDPVPHQERQLRGHFRILPVVEEEEEGRRPTRSRRKIWMLGRFEGYEES